MEQVFAFHYKNGGCPGPVQKEVLHSLGLNRSRKRINELHVPPAKAVPLWAAVLSKVHSCTIVLGQGQSSLGGWVTICLCRHWAPSPGRVTQQYPTTLEQLHCSPAVTGILACMTWTNLRKIIKTLIHSSCLHLPGLTLTMFITR